MYQLSHDRKKIIVHKDDALYVFDSSKVAPEKLDEAKIDLQNWTFSVDPGEEWRQIFADAWRMERDYFYDRNLHGVDWQGLLNRYLPLVDRVTDRHELNDLIGQMLGELSASHTAAMGGDLRRGSDEVSPASLGAVLIKDAGGYRIKHIFQSEPDYIDGCSPFAKPESKIREGDIIEEINGVPTLSVPHLACLLKNKAGQQVLLRMKSATSGDHFNEIVKPISPGEAQRLRYDEWEYKNRLLVEELGNSEIGYVHLRAMVGENYAEWARNFYPIFNRKGLIVDVRNNSGGNIDSWILERLLRRAWFYWQPRVGKPTWNMRYAFRGHMTVLCNELTGSDGETFAEGFRRLGLGKVIGTRTAGGQIWLSYNNGLADKGMASVAQIGVYGPEGEWLIEGHGVEPDIVVDNLPHATFQGEDAQLKTALVHLQELICLNPVEVPPTPNYPNKSFRYA